MSVAQLAVERLEPARVVWGQGDGRRRRQPPRAYGGRLQRRLDPRLEPRRAGRHRGDDAAGPPARRIGDRDARRLRLPSRDDRLRHVRLLRRLPGARCAASCVAATGGDCVFFQGAGGNVLPRFAFTDDESEAERMGSRIAIAALESVADRLATPVELVRLEEGSVTPISKYRRAQLDVEAPELAAVAETVTIPLMPHPPLEEVVAATRGVRPRPRRRASDRRRRARSRSPTTTRSGRGGSRSSCATGRRPRRSPARCTPCGSATA